MRGNSKNLAAAAGGWSAVHRGEAILGWLGFVLIAFAAGCAIGQRFLVLPSAMNLLGEWNSYLPTLRARRGGRKHARTRVTAGA